MSNSSSDKESQKRADPQMPRHVAVIMDGNGRWARRRGKPRTEGHRAGAIAAREIVEHAARLGLKQLTLYSFSIENWSRPVDEVNTLMRLYIEYLISERPVMLKNNIRFRQIGRRDGLPPDVLEELDQTIAALDHNTGMTLCLAVNYGSRAEIADAVRAIASKVRAGTLDIGAITEQTIADHLYTAGMPDPDLLIRTAGEMRVSNYLLWQISYAELFVTDVCWPDFTAAEFDRALADYARRERRFGGLNPAT
jgi:undecaprenyl diphosphate synthase